MNTLLIALVGAALLTTILDWLQTLYIARHPLEYHEINPILGLHPSVTLVNVYFTLCTAVGLSIVAALYWLGAYPWLAVSAACIAAMEAYWVRHNWRIGIRIFSKSF